MKRTVAIALAVSVVTLGGATSGALIGKSPVLQRDELGAELPQPDFSYSASNSSQPAQKVLPNHYPIETPEGRFEVNELRARGIMRNRHFSHYDRIYAQERMALDAQYADREAHPYEPDPAFADAEWQEAGGQAPPPKEGNVPPPPEPRVKTVIVSSPPRTAPSQAALAPPARQQRPDVEANSGIY